MKKRIISLLTAFCMVSTVMLCISASAESTSTNNSSDNGVMRENFTANDAASEMGLGLNLGNTMEAYWLDISNIDSGAQTIGKDTPDEYEKCWGAPTTTHDMIDGIKAAGFNTVRIPVFWGNMMKNDGTFTINKDYIARVKEIVDYCRDNDMYVVINMHHYDEFLIRRYTADMNLDLEGCSKTISVIWKQIAEYFKGYSDFLIFEGFNEYLGGGPLKDKTDPNKGVIDLPKDTAYEWTNTLNQTFVNAVRSTGSNNSERILIVSGYWTNIDLTTSSAFKIPQDEAQNKLMVSVHYVDNSMYWSNLIGGDRWMSYSIDQCEKLKKAFTEKGIPVFIGETTSSYPRSNFVKEGAIITDSSEALKTMLELITDYGFIPVLWDTTNQNSFYDRYNCKIMKASDAEVIKTVSEKIKNHEDPTEPESSLVFGTVTVANADPATPVHIEVTVDGKSVYTGDTVSGEYSVSLKEGENCVVTFSMENCAPRSYEISADKADIALDPELKYYGDLNNDGEITTADTGTANQHAVGNTSLTDYDFYVADVSGDGTITTLDVGMINAHAVGTASLWK